MLECILQTSQLFAVYCSRSCIIILVLVLKCSKPQDHEVNFIISIKQCLIEFEINLHLVRVFHAIVTSSSQHLTDKVDLLNPLDARSRYTDFAQTSLRHQNAVYRLHGLLPHAPEVGIPAARCITASRRKTVYSICFLKHTGPSIPES